MLFRRAPQKVEELKIVIVGAGEVGFHIAQRLSEEQKQVVVIDQNPDKLRRIEDNMDVQTVLGSGSIPSVLKNAGAGDAAIFLAVTDSDETNIVACLFANTIAPKAMKLARIRTEEYTAYPQLLGSGSLQISMLINPEQEIVRSIERLLTLPGAVEYGQLADGFIRMVGMRVESGPLIEQPLTRFREIVQDDGIMVGAIARGQKLIVPSGSDVIKAGDTVYFAYKPTSQRALLRALHKTRGSLGTACIVGGDAAEMLEALVDEESLVAGKRVHELGLPKGILLLGVIRGGEAFIPSGQTVIQPQDRIVLLSLREKMSKLEGIVSKKKE